MLKNILIKAFSNSLNKQLSDRVPNATIQQLKTYKRIFQLATYGILVYSILSFVLASVVITYMEPVSVLLVTLLILNGALSFLCYLPAGFLLFKINSWLSIKDRLGAKP